jgi:nucleotide-binding universal stress UspA family protein
VSSRALELRRTIDRDVEFEVLHGGHTGRSITDFAGEMNASLIFLATHGRTGLARVRSGSVAAEVVRHALCPVVLFRPPELQNGSELASSGGTAAR